MSRTDPFGGSRIIPVSIGDQAYEVVKEAIVKGTLKPGQRLNPEELAKSLGISRTPLREALLRLEIDGLVVRQSSGGFSVSLITEAGIRELYTTASVLEGLAAAEAAKRADDSVIKHLETIHFQASAVASVDLASDAIERGESFHRVIHQASGNEKCCSLLANLQVERRRVKYMVFDPSMVRNESFKEHAQIIKRLKARDPDGSERAMREHIMNGMARVLKRLAELNIANTDIE